MVGDIISGKKSACCRDCEIHENPVILWTETNDMNLDELSLRWVFDFGDTLAFPKLLQEHLLKFKEDILPHKIV